MTLQDEEFYHINELGCTIILHVDLKSKVVSVVGKYVNCSRDNITLDVIESTEFFTPGQRCTFYEKYIVAHLCGPKLFDNSIERQLKYWQETKTTAEEQLKNIDLSSIDKNHYEGRLHVANQQLNFYAKYRSFLT